MRMHVADLDASSASVCDVQTELNSFGFLRPVSAVVTHLVTRQFLSQACQILLFRLASFLDAQVSSFSDDFNSLRRTSNKDPAEQIPHPVSF